MLRTVFLVGALLCAAGYSQAAEENPKPSLVIDEKSAGKTVNAKVGDLLEFRLQGDRAMTGWGGGVPKHVGEKNKPPVLERGATRFEAAEGAKDSAIGTYCFQAKAFELGTVDLRFRYIHPDGNGYEGMPRLATQVVREFKVTVKVTP